MMNEKYRIFDCVTSFRLRTIRFDPYRANLPLFPSGYWSLLSESRLKGRMVCVQEESNTNTPMSFLKQKCRSTPAPNDNLFISPECKVNRNMYRKSNGYHIVRNKDKADKIIVPNPDTLSTNLKYKYPTVQANMFVYRPSTGELETYTIDRAKDLRNLQPDDLQKDIDAIKQYFNIKLSQEDCVFVYDNGLNLITAEVFKYCEEYKEVFEHRGSSNKYCMESLVPLDFPRIIDAEQLLLWENERDSNFLVKTILSSDWRKYPFTIRKFLCYNNRFWESLSKSAANPEWKDLLIYIGYKEYEPDDIYEIVNPDDWNLYQKYLLLRLGLDEKGGFINTPFANNNYVKFLRHKMAVAPLFIDKPMSLKNIQTILDNC